MAPKELAPAYPTFAAAESARAELSDDPARRTFEIGVRALIHGLTAWAREGGERSAP